MKILGGKLKGRNFYMPAGIRSTQNMARKAVFDIIGHDLSEIEFLDLFAGSGGVGLEAVSFGAPRVVWVEKNLKYASVLRENLALLGIQKEGEYSDHAQLIEGDAFVAIKQFSRQGKKFNIVFLDPPYNLGLAKKTLKTLEGYDILQPTCYVVVEHGKRELLPERTERFSLLTQRKYGLAYLSIYEKLH